MPKLRSSRRRALAIATGVALLAGALLVPTAGTATAAPSAGHLHDDFNGDGYPDLAIGAPMTALGGKEKAGAVSVLYGSASGVSPSRKQALTWPSRVNERYLKNRYGSMLQSADIDGDGYADLLSMVEGLTAEGGQEDAEYGHWVTVNWGGPEGLSGEPTLLTGYPQATYTFGFTVGDVDGDHHPDVVTWGTQPGYPDRQGTVQHGPLTRTGGAAGTSTFNVDPNNDVYPDLIAAGDVTGDGIADLAVSTRAGEADSRGVALLVGGKDGFTHKGWLKDTRGRGVGGEEVAIGDLNGDGHGDIVVGHWADYFDSDADLPTKGGALAVVYGGPDGVSTTRKPVWINQDTAGVPGAAERGDGMGSGLSVGDTDGDGYLDVATGLPGEDFDGITDAGRVLVLRGGANGLTGSGAKSFSQNTSGVPGTAEKGDRFGAATALFDADGDGKSGLAVGDPRENAYNGSAWVFRAVSGGVTANGSLSFGAAKVGLPATVAQFGETLNR